ncbi:hypothetical protein ILYODFUR_026683 [Ilyodon furcidens]|uniref:Uncharacterized protein n=1 Tax=Ilyodon furcidens TaxID=33524 RepID=A0ABV0T0G3_9TELE
MEDNIEHLVTYVDKSLSSLWRNFDPLCLPELFYFGNIGLIEFPGMNILLKVRAQHLNQIYVQVLSRPLQNVIYFTIQRWTCWCTLDYCSAAEPVSLCLK